MIRETSLNAKLAPMVAAIAGVLVCVAGWLTLPALQSAQSAAESEASVELERARRLLHEYDANLTYASLLSDRLTDEVAELALDDISSAMEDEYQALHTTMWEAYVPTDWRSGRDNSPRQARTNYGNASGDMRQGLRAAADSIEQNARLLDQAKSAVNKALSVSVGDASSRDHAEANRLKGTVLHYMGMAARVEARLQRSAGDWYRRRLIALATQAQAARASQALVSGSEVDQRIADLNNRGAELEAAYHKDKKALAALDDRVEDLETQLAAAQARRTDALREMDDIKAKGIDFSDPQGGERFSIRLKSFDKAFRESDREVRRLQFGDFSSAHIDQSGDFLNGKYVENGSSSALTVEHGLLHFRGQQAVLAARITGLDDAGKNLYDDIARLEGMKASFAESQSRALADLRASTEAAAELFDELNRIDSEAFAIEDQALDLLDQAARAAKQASRNADLWVREARDKTQGMSSETKGRSAMGSRINDGWMGGFIAAEEADAQLAMGWIHFDRYDAARKNVALLEKVADVLELKEADVESEREKLTAAHDAGLEEIKAAVRVLESAHRGSDRHWTLSAQAAGATYLLSLLGHEDYVADTIEAYRAALKGRETESFAETFATRLSRLERR